MPSPSRRRNEGAGGVADLKLLQTDDEDVVAQGAAGADVLLVFHTIKLGERTIARLPRCRGIIRCGVGYDNVDIQAAGGARHRGVQRARTTAPRRWPTTP